MLVGVVMPALLSVSIMPTSVQMSEQPNTLQHHFWEHSSTKEWFSLNTLWLFYVFSLIHNILGLWSWIMFMNNCSHIAYKKLNCGNDIASEGWMLGPSGNSFMLVNCLCSSYFSIWMALSIKICPNSSCLKVKLKSCSFEKLYLSGLNTLPS